MRSKTKLQSCCGSSAYLYILKSGVLAEHVKLFEDHGFNIMQNYLKLGIIQAQKSKLNVTVTIGQVKINARCYGGNCEELFQDLERLIEKIENV